MSAERKFCKSCGGLFDEKRGYRIHLQRVHGGTLVLPVVCGGCNEAFGSDAVIDKHRAMGLCAGVNASSHPRAWTLELATENIPEKLSAYLPQCFAVFEQRPVLSPQHRADLAYAWFAVEHGLGRKAHQGMIRLLSFVAVEPIRPASINKVFQRLDAGGYYPRTPWDADSPGSLCVPLTVSPVFHMPATGDPAGAVNIRCADMMRALVDSLFDGDVIGDVEHPYVLSAMIR